MNDASVSYDRFTEKCMMKKILCLLLILALVPAMAVTVIEGR